MRFVPGLAMFADGPVDFDGDEQAYARPMKPVLDGLEQLGACIEYHGEEGRLPFTIIPPQTVSQCAEPSVVSIDSSGSSQFISGLLLVGSRVPGGLELHHTGEKTPSLPHIRMTVADLQGSGVRANADEHARVWTVQPGAVPPRSLAQRSSPEEPCACPIGRNPPPSRAACFPDTWNIWALKSASP